MAIYDPYVQRTIFIDALDDEPQFEVSNSFEGGQVSNARSILLQPNQTSQLTNIDISLKGECTTRRGSIALDSIVGGVSNPSGIQGMSWYSTSANEYLVAVNNAKLYQWTGASWTNFGAAWTNASTSAMTFFGQVSNKLYFCNGTNNLFSWDGTTLTDLGNASNAQPPPNAKLCEPHTNRLVVCGTGANRSTLYFSQFLDGTLYDKAKWSMDVGSDNDEIVAIKSWSNFNLLVFKRHSIWAVNCDPSLQLQDIDNTIQFFEVKAIHRQLGCIAPLSVQQVGNDVFFLSQHGVYSINKIVAGGSDEEIGPDLSYPVHDVIERLNLSAASGSAAIGLGNKYILSFPKDSSSSNNAMMVWNDTLQVWPGEWTGWNASCFAYCSPTTGNLLRFGTETGGGLVKEWLDYVQLLNETTATYQDSGVDIPASVTTKSYTFGGISNLKTGRSMRADFYNSLADVTLTVLLDRDAPRSLSTIPGAGGNGIMFPLTFPILFPAIKTTKSPTSLQNLGQFAEIKFKFDTTGKKLNLTSVGVAAWLDSLDDSGSWTNAVST